MTFLQKLKKVIAFFEPQALKSVRVIMNSPPQETGLLVIDMQNEFCNPQKRRGNHQTAEISAKITSLIPDFKKAGFRVYCVYFGDRFERRLSELDIYCYTPQYPDRVIVKDHNSAFEGSDIKKVLEADGIKNLLICGFNKSACVLATGHGAVENGFNTVMITDLRANDSENENDPFPLLFQRIGRISSKRVLNRFKKKTVS